MDRPGDDAADTVLTEPALRGGVEQRQNPAAMRVARDQAGQCLTGSVAKPLAPMENPQVQPPLAQEGTQVVDPERLRRSQSLQRFGGKQRNVMSFAPAELFRGRREDVVAGAVSRANDLPAPQSLQGGPQRVATDLIGG